MKCSNWHVEISALLDGQLDPSVERHLRAHLDNCRECSALLQDLTSSHDVFVQARHWRLTPPAHIWTTLRAQLQPAQPSPSPIGWLASLFTVPRYSYATALAMLVVSLFFVAQRQENMARQSLAALDAYHLEVEGNPFFVQPSNPAGSGTNPFEQQ